MAGKMVEFPSNGGTTAGLSGHARRRQGPGRARDPGVVGPGRPHQERVRPLRGRRLLGAGPRLYHGQTASEPDGAGKLFMALNIEQAEKDLRGAAKYLRRHSSTAKLGAVGFCMGGQLALFAGCTNPSVGRGGGLLRHPSQREAGLHAS